MSNATNMKVLLVPDEIIRSVKDEKNKTLQGVNYAAISNEKAFLSGSNVRYISKHMYLKHRMNGGQMTEDVFTKAIPTFMKVWSVKENLDSFEGYNNYHWVLTLDYINNKFMRDYKKFYTVNGADSNVFKARVPVGYLNEYDGSVFESKKYDEMTAQDYQNLDVYGPMEVYTQNKEVYRYKNKIPVWQKSMNQRHYSRDNEGLRSNNWARASLEVPIRGYDMDGIIRSTGKYKLENQPEWVDF